ncbi:MULTISPECIES: helix-turn-helix domain-containing protein [Roseobacteraceae]|jgi:AraC-like DNA-binding protein|uniref:AraC family transcriptional regulator n=1 Tax=Celeribacter baekdonensis B30 TaxID=1208323 RepID=K2J953_9RHOB|nr:MULTISPECIES: helix-turn-helix domain-containing protein [Roseobacteraceae]EKE71773.1 AraC family transcriptional regulator [Celeribacter baekdonensis B30]KAB6715121.1 AraC family transcriptional regulator [Roseobacter sp. TSBP12]|tara:strand:- start:1318 stop:2328 length:1011 start_codon:yes stop_codon:yes gene_type:complete
MLETALLEDRRGAPLLQDKLTTTRDWSVVNAFCATTYMPLSTRPLTRGMDPNATIRNLKIGQITFSRFCFGTPTKTDDFDPSSGNIIVVNTLRGSVRHPLNGNDAVDTRPGDSYVVDCSRTSYWNLADGNDLQLNLTIPHALMEETAARWYGFVPEDDLWQNRLIFGAGQSAWLSLLDYATRTLDAKHDGIADAFIERRIEETLCLDLLRNWADCAGLNLDTGARAAAPHYVREAERLMQDTAARAPTIGEVAAQLGITARSLSDGFRRFRGITPHEFLTAQRLDGLRRALQLAQPGETVTSIARARGYVNLGAMTALYRKRFGETPANTLRNRRT